LPGRSVIIPAVLGLVAAIVLVALAFLAPATQHHAVGPVLLVNGRPVLDGAVADLSRPITVTGQTAGGDPFQLVLSLSASGVRLGSTPVANIRPEPDGRFTTTVQLPSVTRWIVGGAVTGELTLSRPGQPAAVARFTLKTKQTPIASALGAGSLLLTLFAAAYIESTLRVLRRGHRLRGAPVTGAVLGALFGASVWLLVSVLTRHEPAGAYGLGCAVAGAVAAVGVVLATQRRQPIRRPA
jgi:serine/threonine-protein kinase